MRGILFRCIRRRLGKGMLLRDLQRVQTARRAGQQRGHHAGLPAGNDSRAPNPPILEVNVLGPLLHLQEASRLMGRNRSDRSLT